VTASTTDVVRCAWPGSDPLYCAYHDEEWGTPERDARALWEKLVLDGFQAGLSWITILRKREAFRQAFRQFDPDAVAAFGAADVERLMADPGIVRARAKITGAIGSARAYLAMRERGEDFADFIWGFVDGAPIQNAWTTREQVPTQTPLSVELSKALKARGFSFCGPVIVYAFLQATGVVNDHLQGCFRHEACRRLASFETPLRGS
jgi:DNA-3-methyladenine glycosylase I